MNVVWVTSGTGVVSPTRLVAPVTVDEAAFDPLSEPEQAAMARTHTLTSTTRRSTLVPFRTRWGGDGSDGTLPHVASDDKLPIKMLNDRVLVRIPDKDGERRSMGGILIPATAQLSKRLVWAEVVALGQNVRTAEVGDRVLFSPEDRYEVEVGGTDYIMLRERDIHAVAATRIEASTGLYL